MKRAGVRLVIDASVARAAGAAERPSADDPQTSESCRETLTVVRDRRHRIFFTPPVYDEWCRHRSRFSYLWLGEMRARRLVEDQPEKALPKLRNAVERAAIPESVRYELEKDIPLVEAALQADRRLLSRDAAARTGFAALTSEVRQLRTLVWVDPCRSEDGAVSWLTSGCPVEAERTLATWP